MSIAAKVEECIPYLRRYARAATGSTVSGDTCVELALQSILEGALGPELNVGDPSRAELYKLVDIHLDHVSYSGDSRARRAILLVAMEGLSNEEASGVLGVDTGQLNALIEVAQESFRKRTADAVLIIEDEAMISAQLKRMAERAGHRVVGIATRASDAVRMGRDLHPDLILCDIHLGDGSMGTDAIAELDLPDHVPVVYITAYPEKYLSNANQGPSYLVTKPFHPEYVQAIIGHALLNDAVDSARW